MRGQGAPTGLPPLLPCPHAITRRLTGLHCAAGHPQPVQRELHEPGQPGGACMRHQAQAQGVYTPAHCLEGCPDAQPNPTQPDPKAAPAAAA